MTYAEKFDTAMDAINKRAAEYVAILFPDGPPKEIFTINMASYKPKSKEVTGVSCDTPWFDRNPKRPSKGQVEKIQAYLESTPDYANGEIYIRYREKDNRSTTTGAYRMSEIRKSKSISFNPDDLLAECTRLSEFYTLKEGDINCAYCGKAFPGKDAVTRKIISYANYGPQGVVNKYCSGECGGYDQMAHEG